MLSRRHYIYPAFHAFIKYLSVQNKLSTAILNGYLNGTLKNTGEMIILSVY